MKKILFFITSFVILTVLGFLSFLMGIGLLYIVSYILAVIYNYFTGFDPIVWNILGLTVFSFVIGLMIFIDKIVYFYDKFFED